MHGCFRLFRVARVMYDRYPLLQGRLQLPKQLLALPDETQRQLLRTAQFEMELLLLAVLRSDRELFPATRRHLAKRRTHDQSLRVAGAVAEALAAELDAHFEQAVERFIFIPSPDIEVVTSYLDARRDRARIELRRQLPRTITRLHIVTLLYQWLLLLDHYLAQIAPLTPPPAVPAYPRLTRVPACEDPFAKPARQVDRPVPPLSSGLLRPPPNLHGTAAPSAAPISPSSQVVPCRWCRWLRWWDRRYVRWRDAVLARHCAGKR